MPCSRCRRPLLPATVRRLLPDGTLTDNGTCLACWERQRHPEPTDELEALLYCA